MGIWAEFTIMDSKRAFCPGSSSKISQHIINDHMTSHYKKVYSAKSVVDCTVPKSMLCNVKYTDQKRREKLKNGMSERAQSLRSLSQRSSRLNTMTSFSYKNTLPYAPGDESARCCLGESTVSSPRFSSSFHCKQIVYPSPAAPSFLNCHPPSELIYRSLKSQRHLNHSCASTVSQQNFKSFQDPVQKTYSGDILVKHTHCFTEEKPFTPRTLKSDSKSTLFTYRYYTPPNWKRTEKKALSKSNQQDTYHESKRGCSPGQESPQPYVLDQEWSDEESNVFGHCSTANKYRNSDLCLSSSRVSPEGMRSPIMRKVTAQEEELMYMEFITDVTDDIIARGIYSDRVLKRVFERHIEMNRRRLDENKMRHLLDELQNDLQHPPSASMTTLEEKERDSSLLFRHKYLNFGEEMSTEKSESSPWTLFHKDTEEHQDPLSRDSTTFKESPANAESIGQEDKQDIIDLELDHKEENVTSPSPHNHSISEDDRHQMCTDNQLLNELDELGRNMEESLCVSEPHHSQEAVKEMSPLRLSDDEF